MNYYDAGFAGYLDGKDYNDVIRTLGINPSGKRHWPEIQEIIRGWSEADKLDRDTTPAHNAA